MAEGSRVRENEGVMRSEVEQERDKEKVESVVTCLVFSFEA